MIPYKAAYGIILRKKVLKIVLFYLMNEKKSEINQLEMGFDWTTCSLQQLYDIYFMKQQTQRVATTLLKEPNNVTFNQAEILSILKMIRYRDDTV